MLPSFKLFGITFFTYSLAMGAAWGLAFQVARNLSKSNALEKQWGEFYRLKFFFFGTLIISWVGAKGFYLLSGDFSGKGEAAVSANFWLGGGFVFYGGLISALIFALIFALKTKQPAYKFNIFVPALAIGHGIGRLGCFLAGCCYGKAYQGFGSVHLHGLDRWPTQLIEAFFLLLFGVLAMRKKWQGHKDLTLYYLGYYAILRFGIEFLRGDRVRGIWFANLSTSQLVSLGLFLALLITMPLLAKNRSNHQVKGL